MKLFILITAVFFISISSSYGYIDDKEVDEAETSAGDQNTNLYRLNAQGIVSIKKFKKVDELVRRREAAGKIVDTSDIETLFKAEKKDSEAEEIKKKTALVDKLLIAPKQLIKKVTPEIYNRLIAMHQTNVRDKNVVVTLNNELQRRRKR